MFANVNSSEELTVNEYSNVIIFFFLSSKINFCRKNLCRNNSNTDQARHFVGPYLDPNFAEVISSRQKSPLAVAYDSKQIFFSWPLCRYAAFLVNWGICMLLSCCDCNCSSLYRFMS